MGVIVPRPAMRKGERRKVEDRLARHAALMEKLMIPDEEWTREACSAEAFRQLREIERAEAEAKAQRKRRR